MEVSHDKIVGRLAQESVLARLQEYLYDPSFLEISEKFLTKMACTVHARM
jgi:hypothetical protein